MPLFTPTSIQFVLRTLARLGVPSRELEDLAQEVFVVVHRRAADFDAGRPPEAWLYGIARNVVRDYRRLSATRHEVLAEAEDARTIDQAITPAAAVNDDVRALWNAIAALDEPLQDVLILSDLGELTLEATASQLSIPFNTAKDRLRRARSQLRAALGKVAP